MTTPHEIAMACEVCGKQFFAHRYRVERGRGKTCSRECGRAKAVAAFQVSRPVITEAEIVAALWSHVERMGPDECWPWRGRSKNAQDSRGILCIGGKRYNAPRVAYFAEHGEWPAKGVFVCHSCDNPPCCNPAHLWLGTPRDNMIDARDKGRLDIRNLTRNAGWQKRLTHCKRGHPLSGDNVLPNNGGGRACRICMRAAQKAYRERIKAKAKGVTA